MHVGVDSVCVCICVCVYIYVCVCVCVCTYAWYVSITSHFAVHKDENFKRLNKTKKLLPRSLASEGGGR